MTRLSLSVDAMLEQLAALLRQEREAATKAPEHLAQIHSDMADCYERILRAYDCPALSEA